MDTNTANCGKVEPGTVVVKFRTGRRCGRAIKGFERIENTLRRINRDDTWATAIRNVFGLNVESDKFSIRKGDLLGQQWGLNERVGSLLDTFVNTKKIYSVYIVRNKAAPTDTCNKATKSSETTSGRSSALTHEIETKDFKSLFMERVKSVSNTEMLLLRDDLNKMRQQPQEWIKFLMKHPRLAVVLRTLLDI